MINGFVSFLETTSVAAAIRDSVLLTGFLSGLHLVGVTLIGGGALVAGLRSSGMAFGDFPLRDITRTTRRGIALGVTISIASGLLLFSPRASTAAASGYFQIKMLLLAGAVACQFAMYPTLAARRNGAGIGVRVIGTIGAALWLAVILAGCSYILLEG